MSRNEIGDDGAFVLAIALQYNTTLLNFEINGNEVSKVGASAVVTALTSNKTLLVLDVTCNEIGSVGVHAIANACIVIRRCRHSVSAMLM